MKLKSYIREKIIAVVRYAVREEFYNCNGIPQIPENTNEKSLEQVEEEIISCLDKQIERWTWERYKRLEHENFPKLEKQLDAETWNLKKELDKKIEKWTWDRCQRLDKKIEKWTWDRYQRLDKRIEEWSWDRYQRLDKRIEVWTWERYQRTENLIERLNEEIKVAQQYAVDLLYENNKIRYFSGEKIRVVMLFQIPSCWPSVKSVWDELVRDSRFEVTILLYDREKKEPNQMAGAREFLIENDISFIEAEYYDFEKEKPHIFIYQTPWDDRHRPDFLKSDTIKKKGIRIAYLPYGIEYSASVRLSWIFSIMQFRAKPWISFALSPQVLLEHKLQSKYGADFLITTGLPKFDILYNKENIKLEETVLDKVGKRKIVFWQMHFPALDGNKNYPVPNIEVYLQFAKKICEYDEYFFLVRPHPKFFEMYVQKGFVQEVEEFCEILENLENVYMYTQADYMPALVNANYIIGDRSALMVESIVLDVPTLYMTNFYYKERMLDAIEPIFSSYYQGSECYDMELFMDMIVRKGMDYKSLERKKAKELCIPLFDGRCGKRIVDSIAEKIYKEVNSCEE